MRGIVAALVLGSAGCFAHSIHGSGHVIRESRSVGEFTAVEVGGGIRASVTTGPQSVEVEADDNVAPLVETSVDGGTLTVRFKRHTNIWNADVNVRIAMRDVRSLSASGGAEIVATLDRTPELEVSASGGARLRASRLDVDRLTASGSGGAKLELEGAAQKVRLDMSGGTRVRAGRLDADTMSIHGSGGCTAVVRANRVIRGSLSGGTGVRLLGRASTRVSTSGGSSIEYEDE